MNKKQLQKYRNRSLALKVVVRDKYIRLREVNLGNSPIRIILAIIEKKSGNRKRTNPNNESWLLQ